MSLSTRFPVAIHILTFLASVPERNVSSESLAKSIATNPAAIRKTLGLLVQAGLVTSQAGINGGAKLTKPADEISLLEIYQAVESSALFQMHTPQPRCPLTKVITPEIESVFEGATEAFESSLAEQTLATVASDAILSFQKSLAKR